MSRKTKLTQRCNTDSLRDEFESSHEWKLRKMFIDANIDSLATDRLVCLSKCFVNSAMYGCSYPRLVMNEITARSGGILQEYQEGAKTDRLAAAKSAYAASFVKASNDCGADGGDFLPTLGPEDKSNASHESVNSGSLQQEMQARSNDTSSCLHSSPYESGGTGENDQRTLSADVRYQPSAVEVVDTNYYQEEQSQGGPYREGVSSVNDCQLPPAKPVLSLDEYSALLAEETDPVLKRLRTFTCRLLSYEKESAMLKFIEGLGRNKNLRPGFRLDPKLAKKMGVANVCHIVLGDSDIRLATQASRFQGLAKTNVYEAALQKLYLPYLRVVRRDGYREVEASRDPFPEDQTCTPVGPWGEGLSKTAKKKLRRAAKTAEEQGASEASTEKGEESNTGPTTRIYSNSECVEKRRKKGNWASDNFIIVEHINNANITAREYGILEHSANFSCALMECEITCLEQGVVNCVIRLNGEVVGEASGHSKKIVKEEAAGKALARLRPTSWQLKLKRPNSEDSLSKEKLLQDMGQKKTETIGEGNVGNQLLRKMGWTGGGVGKHGSGIVEPVAATSVLGRAGLGLATFSVAAPSSSEKVVNARLFRRQISQALKNFMASAQQDDLQFAPEFSKDERKIMHEEARKLGLRTVSRGKGDNRVISVGLKRSSQQLLQHVSGQGGETKDYILLPPGSDVGQVNSTS